MAESHRDEIAKLEALHASHPEGRVFTHLAEAYRRAGDVARAREILDDGLSRHPDYPSAHVVLGRLLIETGETAGAAAAFRRVLELDRHNVVALRSLGELAEREGRLREALHYYEELSRLDFGSEALRAQVRELEAAIGEEPSLAAWDASGEEAPAATGPAADAVESMTGADGTAPDGDAPAPGGEAPAEAPAPEAASEGGDAGRVAAEAGSPPTAVDAGPDETLVGEWVPQDRWDRFARDEASHAGDVEAGSEVDADAAGDVDLAFLGGTEETGSGDQGFVLDVGLVLEGEPAEEEARAAGDEVPPQDMPGVEPLSGLEVPAGGPDAQEVEALIVGEAPDAAHDEPVIDVLIPEELAELEPAAARQEPERASEASAADDLPVEDDIDEWVTETMAEVYAAQGLTERAVEVYRLLRRERPADDRILARLVELEEALAGPAMPEMAGYGSVEDDADDEAAAEAREAWLASVESAWTGGQGAVGATEDSLYGWATAERDVADAGPTAGDLFRALLGWRPAAFPPAPEAPAEASVVPWGAAPEAPGAEGGELLLEELVEDAPTPAPGAESAEPETVASAFEAMFGTGEPAAPAAPASGPTGSEPPSRAAPAPPSPPDPAESEQDLEMFRTWLQSLKK